MAEDTQEVPIVSIDVAQERNKPRLISLLFYDNHNLTANNKVNFLGVFDRLYVNPVSKKTIPMGVFLRMANVYGGTISVSVFNPDSVVVAGFGFKIPIEQIPEDKRGSQVQSFIRLSFDVKVEGKYWFDVSYEGQSIGGNELIIEFREGIEDGNTAGDA